MHSLSSFCFVVSKFLLCWPQVDEEVSEMAQLSSRKCIKKLMKLTDHDGCKNGWLMPLHACSPSPPCLPVQ